ncbi:MAG: hypothetical protein LBQ42_10770 [Synergistaceae bacterium]|nr:hypothetical protein [Synergistaceae bacterium]
MADFSEGISAREYLDHRYGVRECSEPEGSGLPLDDEDFVREWEAWLDDPESAPSDVRDVLSDETISFRLETTPAGRLPVAYTTSRNSFERLARMLYPGGGMTEIPASVNAFTIKAKHPDLHGHRLILLHRMGYSALSGDEMGIAEEEWIEKSRIIRLHHEISHYFSLRVLGGMRNHALDEIAADCAGQLAAFGTFSASTQKRFFGISEGRVLPGGRFSFYIKRLRADSTDEVLEETESALSTLENYLSRNSDMTRESARPRLITRLLAAGIRGIRDLQ